MLIALPGLDPHFDLIPSFYRSEDREDVSVLEVFVRDIAGIYTSLDVPVKIQSAFFEKYGAAGWTLFWKAARTLADNGVKVIADIKRSDISSTAKAYSEGFLHSESPFWGITVNGYLGTDGILPFLEMAEKNDKFIWLLLLTSNPSAAELQKLKLKGGKMVFQHLLDNWDDFSTESLGFVVGATKAAELEGICRKNRDRKILVPGIGKQGGKLEELSKIKNELWCANSRAILFPDESSYSDRESYCQRVSESLETFKRDVKRFSN